MSDETQRCCDGKPVGVLRTEGANPVVYCDAHAPAGVALADLPKGK